MKHYCIQEKVNYVYSLYPLVHHKWRFVKWTLNKLMQLTNATSISTSSTFERVSVDEELTTKLLYDIAYGYMAAGYHVKSFLVGPEQYYKIMRLIETPIYLSKVQTKFGEFDLILHPLVEGVIPLDFSR